MKLLYLSPFIFEVQPPYTSHHHCLEHPSPRLLPPVLCPVTHPSQSPSSGCPQSLHLSCFWLCLPTLSLISLSALDPTVPVLHVPGHSSLPTVTAFSMFQVLEACPSVIRFLAIWSSPLCIADKCLSFPELLGQLAKASEQHRNNRLPASIREQMGKLVHPTNKLVLLPSPKPRKIKAGTHTPIQHVGSEEAMAFN